MKILIYGAGVQGSFLAHVLTRGKNDVTVLARENRAKELESNGIILRHYMQHKTTVDHVNIINELRPEDVYDVIFVTMKYTDFPQVLLSLARNSSTNIILVGNNATASEMESYLEEHSKNQKNIAFGFQMSGGKRDKNRTIVLRFDGGEMMVGGLTKDIIWKDKLEESFKNTKYKITYQKDIDAWLKSHMIMILPMNLAAYLKAYHFKAVAKDNQLLRQVVAAMDEGYDVLRDLGYEIIPAKQAAFVKQHKYLNFLFYKLFHYSPLANQVEGAFAELKGLYDMFYDWKDKSKVLTPNMDLLVQQAEEIYTKGSNQ